MPMPIGDCPAPESECPATTSSRLGGWRLPVSPYATPRSALALGSSGSALGLAAGGLALGLRGGSGLVERGTWATGGLAGHLACVVEDWISGT
jgi:hypothetical protein